MGIMSVEKADRLYWLGRYSERVLTSLINYLDCLDEMIDGDEYAYRNYLNRLGLTDIYGSKEAFRSHYLFDSEDPNSILNNMERAYDNAIVLKNELGTYTYGYLMMALNKLKTGEELLTAPSFQLQKVIDHLNAFWGCMDDQTEDEECRNLIKTGKYMERMDLYLRLGYPAKALEREYSKLMNRMRKQKFGFDPEAAAVLEEIIGSGDAYRERTGEALAVLGRLFRI